MLQRYWMACHVSESNMFGKSDDINDWCKGEDVGKLETEVGKLKAENKKLRNKLSRCMVELHHLNKRLEYRYRHEFTVGSQDLDS